MLTKSTIGSKGASIMKRVRHLSEEALHQVASQIGESFWDYPYADGEGGLKALIPSRQLAGAVSVTLSDEELRQLAAAADQTQVKILGADLFRFAVRGSR